MEDRKALEKQFRRKIILDAARALFLEKGWESTTMDQVAAKAGFTKRSVYAYFSSKEDLLAGLVTGALEGLNQSYQGALDPEATGFAQVEALGHAFLRYSEINRNQLKLLPFLDVIEPDVASQCWQDLFQVSAVNYGILKGALDRGIQDGSVSDQLPSGITAFFLMVTTTALIRAADSLSHGKAQALGFGPEEFMKFGMQFIGRGLASGGNSDKNTKNHRC